MSNDLEHLEVILRIQNAEQIEVFYGPVLEFLGYTKTGDKPGLTVWISQSRRTSLVLAEIAKRIDIRRCSTSQHTTSRLTFTSASTRQIDRLYALLQELGATVLIEPQRYGKTAGEHGVVFRYSGGAIFELKLHDVEQTL